MRQALPSSSTFFRCPNCDLLLFCRFIGFNLCLSCDNFWQIKRKQWGGISSFFYFFTANLKMLKGSRIALPCWGRYYYCYWFFANFSSFTMSVKFVKAPTRGKFSLIPSQWAKRERQDCIWKFSFHLHSRVLSILRYHKDILQHLSISQLRKPIHHHYNSVKLNKVIRLMVVPWDCRLWAELKCMIMIITMFTTTWLDDE